MPPYPTSGELYNYRVMPDVVQVEVLMPNGVITSFFCNREDRLKQVKEKAFDQSKTVLPKKLGLPENYVFVSVNQDAQLEEYHDETRRLCDLRLFLAILRLVERVGDRELARCNAEISRIIGFGSSINDSLTNSTKPGERSQLIADPECIAFRINVFDDLRKTIGQQKLIDKEKVALAIFPPDLQAAPCPYVGNDFIHVYINVTASSGLFPPDTDLRFFEDNSEVSADPSVQKSLNLIEVVCRPNGAFVQFRFVARFDCTILQACELLVRVSNSPSAAGDFVLKVAGCADYVIELDRQFGEIHSTRVGAAARTKPAEYVLVSREAFLNEAYRRALLDPPPPLFDGVSMLRDRAALLSASNTSRVTWPLEDNLRIRVICAAYVQLDGAGSGESALFVRAGVYLAGEPLCEPAGRDTKPANLRAARWNEVLELPISIGDLPRASRLTLTLFTVSLSRQRHENAGEVDKEKPSRVGFANIPLFSFDRALLLGRQSVRLWQVPTMESDAALAGAAACGSYPDRFDGPTLEFELLTPESSADAISIDQALPSASMSRRPPSSFTILVFPSDEMLDQYAKRASSLDSRRSVPPTIEEADKRRLDELVRRGPILLEEFSEQEKQLIWDYRHLLTDAAYQDADALPKVCMAVKWSSRYEVLRFYELLRNWPPIRVETALQLLDASFADLRVRAKAVEALGRLDDSQLGAYLLQLTQALRFEPYVDSALARFLLRRALANQRIGQAFFWHLKADLHQPAVRMRHVLLLDAYLHCCGDSMRTALLKQCDALAKLTHLTEQLRDEQDRRGELKKGDAINFLRKKLSSNDYLEFVQHLPSPLNQSWQLNSITIPFCKVMKSKKKPLWLVWRNIDDFADAFLKNYMLIFKNGDDLRQDMLTLQVLRVMDAIWKSQGQEMYITPYGCFATGRQTGLIEVVQKSKTVMDIIRESKGPAKYRMNQWLLDRNGGAKAELYRDAVHRFRYSCAAYCVATFVIGIGDRHPDNIMMNENGQIFHIDFGHFLNNKKKKFGFQRERVPFILRADFFTIMANGNDATDSVYEDFKQLCLKAYQGLRRHANLILTLFSLMVQAGIPELRSHADLDYLRLTLAVNKTDTQAEEYFSKQFDAAQKKAWTTTIDWWLHNANRQFKK